MNRKIAHDRLFHSFGLILGVLALLTAAALPGDVSAADAARITGESHMQTQAPSGRIVVKLASGSDLVMDTSGVVSRSGGKHSHVARLDALVGSLVSGARLQKRFINAPVTRDPAGPHGHDLPDLALYAHFDGRTRDREALIRMIAALNADPVVDLAYLEPVAVPAALGFDAFTGAVPATNQAGGDAVLDTPNFESQQGYLADAPDGVGAWSMRSQAGARGEGLAIIDVEGGWLWTHEDLPAPYVELGTQIDDLSWRNHGTAVLGEMRGTDNGYGVTGIAPDCEVGCSSIGTASPAEALAAAMDNLDAGDLILIELHAPGPNATGFGQYGYIAMEYWQDNFDVIRLATARGIIVVEAAGNGEQDFDDPVYQGLFQRNVRDSGAIICGATDGGSLQIAWFSNFGSRVDLNGWGYSVTTCGYGDLQGGPEQEWYTSGFSGTSSASPIVTGSVASLQGMVREELGFDLDARAARDILRMTGTPTSDGSLIGTRPDLVAAFDLVETSVGELAGVVTDADTGLPIPGVLITVGGYGGFTVSGADGSWRLPRIAGGIDLVFSSFHYLSSWQMRNVVAGETTIMNVALTPRDIVDITGTVRGAGQPLAGALVAVLNHPVGETVSDSNGEFHLPGIPAGYDYNVKVDGVSGFGALFEVIQTQGAEGTLAFDPVLPAVSEDFADSGDFVSSNGLWSHGSPPVDVTGGAFVGPFCWGVGMDGDYDDYDFGNLNSPVYDLSDISGDQYYLSFHIFSATEVGFDGVNLETSTASGPFTVLEPLDLYTDEALSGLNGEPGWSGNSGRWRGVVFDVSDYIGGSLRFRLVFGADGGLTEQGFFVDGIAFDTGAQISATPDGATPAVVAELAAWPNPFNPLVHLDYAITRPGHLEVAVFDVRGQRVRTLLSAPTSDLRGRLSWNGRDDGGRNLPSGVYLVRLRDSAGQVASQRVVLTK